MTEIIDKIMIISMLLGGIVMTLIGFNIVKLKAKSSKDEDRMVIWRKKFGQLFKIGGIAIFIIGIFLLIAPTLNKKPTNWTQSQKDEMKMQIINSSHLLQSMSPDTADMVVTCFVNAYTEKYTLQQSWDHDKMSQEKIMELTMAMMNECLKLYGIKINK